MVCQYIRQNEIHEKYLLGRLSEQEKEEYLAHVKECESCRRELENQRLLIGGIREAGRREMKSEIRRQVEKMRQERRQETRRILLRIAAVLLFLVLAPGLVYYYQYFAPKGPSVQPEVPVAASGTEEKPPGTPASEELPLAAPSREGQSAAVPGPETHSPTAGKSATGKGQELTANRRRASAAGKEMPRQKAENATQRVQEPSQIREGLAGTTPVLATVPEENKQKGRTAVDVIHQQSATIRDSMMYPRDYAPEGIISPIPIPPGETEGEIYHFSGKPAVGRTTMSLEKKKKQIDRTRNYLFPGKNYRIEIHIQPVSYPEAGKRKGGLPGKFPVKKAEEDSAHLKMTWYVNNAFLQVNPQKITLQKTGSKELWVRLPKEQIYRIDLSRDSTLAIRVR